jgi:hypothetical protein
MGIGNVLDQIWNMPWYKVLVIAAADDVVLIVLFVSLKKVK